MRRSVFHPIVVVAVVAIALSCGSIREDEALCEVAVARLDECCPQMEPRRFNCVHDEGCNNNLYPTFSERASECILDASCDQLRSSGKCEAIRQLSLVPYTFQDRDDFQQEACR